MSNCRHGGFPLRKCIETAGGRRQRLETDMADLGIARLNNESSMNGTLTRADLADVVHRNLGLSRAESANIVERVLHHMCHALAQGQNVKVSGFGTFILRDKGQRIGRNPKTGVEVPIAPRRVMTFRASQIMRDQVSKEGFRVGSAEQAPGALKTTGELVQELSVAQHIRRYWETKFPQLRPMQRAGNRRYYR